MSFATIVVTALLLTAAQNQSAAVRIRVSDAMGFAVPGVTVTVTLAKTSHSTDTTERRAVTDANGVAMFADLPLGTYDISARLAGFTDSHATVIAIRGQMVERPMMLKIAPIVCTARVVPVRQHRFRDSDTAVTLPD